MANKVTKANTGGTGGSETLAQVGLVSIAQPDNVYSLQNGNQFTIDSPFSDASSQFVITNSGSGTPGVLELLNYGAGDQEIHFDVQWVGNGIDKYVAQNGYVSMITQGRDGLEFWVADGQTPGTTVTGDFASKMNLAPTGQLSLVKYGSGTFTGLPTYTLQVDASGNLIESVLVSGVSSVNTDTGAVTLTVANTGSTLQWSTTQLQIPTASTLITGLLSSSNWNTFNGKQNAITTGTTLQYLRGDLSLATLNTSVVPESGNLYFTGARVLATRITGFVSNPGTITSSDTVLSAIDKLDGNINALITGISSVSGTAGRITAVTSLAGAVTVNIALTYVGQTSITTLGTITTGTWNGTAIANANLANSTITVNGTSTALGGSVTITTTGTTNRITVAGGTGLTPTIDISATFEALLGKVANPLSQFASTTSAQLAGVISDETGTGLLVFATGPTISLASASTAVTQTPSDNSTKVATTAYVDAAILGQNFKEACKYASVAALPSIIYANGSSGVGATLTGVALAAISLDGASPGVGDRVLIKNQVSDFQNGIYTVTQTGSGVAVFILTRSLDANQSFEYKTGDSVFITAGNTLATTTWAYTGIDSPTMGTTSLTYAQTAGQGSFTAGNGISITGVSIAIDTSVTVDKTTVQTLTNKTLTAPVMTAPVLGTPTSGVATNLTGLPLTTGVTGTLGIGNGGTGQTTALAAFNALSPMTTAGDIIYGGTSGSALRLAIGGANTVLHGGASAPAYSAVVEADITLANNTTNNVSTTKHGFAPILPNDATKYLDGTGAYSVPSGGGGSGTVTSIIAGTGLTGGTITTTGTIALDLTRANTWTGVTTFTPGARSSGIASYFTINAPADTGITTATESKGINIVGATRTWADGTVATQREYFFGAPTYNKTTTAATFTNSGTVVISGPPIAGTGVTLTHPWSLWVQAGNSHFGAQIGYTQTTVGGTGAEFNDSNATTGGQCVSVQNTNNATNAFSGFNIGNDQTVDGGATSHYFGIFFNSSTYTDTTFGTANAVASLGVIQNTDAPIAYITSSASAGGHYFYDGGGNTGNEVLRVTKTALTYSTAPLEIENSQSGTTYTLVLADGYSKAVTSTSASATTFTVPPNSSVAFPIGTRIDIIQLGTGKLTLAQGSGVTISSQNGNKSLATQYVGATLWKQATNVWILLGNLIP